MNSFHRIAAGCGVLGLLASTQPVRAQGSKAPGAVTLAVAGTSSRGGDFTGTATITRFEQRDHKIVAVGFVQGVLRRGSRAGTGFAGEVRWPVIVPSAGIAAASGREPTAPRLRSAVLSITGTRGMTLVPVQAESCPVLDIALGPVTVNMMGVNVSLSPIALSVTGQTGTPLGDLVCSVSDLLGNVAAVVELLNSLLGLLTGLLGGLTGGLGGVVPAGSAGI
jgi:hypothetical protein